MPKTVLIQQQNSHRYRQVADHLRHLIVSGTYPPLQKLPSVRKLSQQLEVSATTVVEAYRLLEDQGLVQVRPQSGYYVCSPEPPDTAPGQAPPTGREASDLVRQVVSPINVSMGDFLVRHLREFRRPDLVPFGDACPNPDQLPTQQLARAIAKVSKQAGFCGNNYDVPPGCDPLRAQIARRALQSGCVVSPDEVMLTLGCQEALSLCLRAVCQTGDAVAVESPTFYGHLQAIEMLGLRAVEIPSAPVRGISFAALSQAINDFPIRALIVCTQFSNPTGASHNDQDLQELLGILARREIPLIEDDTFGDLAHSPVRPHVAKAFDTADRVLLCSSFSKTMAPGYRLGWVIAGPRYMNRLHQLKLFSNLASPALPALAVNQFLLSGGFDRHLRQMRLHVALQVRQMSAAILEHFPKGTRVSQPRGGYILWVELPEHYDTRLLYAKAIQLGLTISPGPIFSARGRFHNCMRLSATYWSKENAPLITALGHHLCHEYSK